jgi:hypothetical protein
MMITMTSELPDRDPVTGHDLTEFLRGKAFYEEHFDEIKARHQGEYVVIFEGKVVAHTRDLREASRIRRELSPERPLYMPLVSERALPLRHAFPVRRP